MTDNKLFGDFLVARGLITQELLLQSLIDQTQGLPSIAEIVFNGSMLPVATQLEILRVQTKNNWGYQKACEFLGQWNSDLMQKIMAETEKSRKPLGQLILARTNIKFSELTKALDEYLSLENAKSPSETLPSDGKSSVNMGEVHLASIDIGLLNEFMDVFNGERMNRISSKMQLWATARTDSEYCEQAGASMKEAQNELHVIREAAKFVRAELTEKLVYSFETALIRIEKLNGEEMAATLRRLVEPSQLVFQALQNLRSSLETDSSESKYWESDNSRHEYQRAMEAISNVGLV